MKENCGETFATTLPRLKRKCPKQEVEEEETYSIDPPQTKQNSEEISSIDLPQTKQRFEETSSPITPPPILKREFPKRKVALILGYSGTGYQGMQLNPNAKTIEADLFDALCRANLVSKENSIDPKKISWMRSCRTDKGVHAAGQVVSFKMIMKNGSDLDQSKLTKISAELNEILRSDMKLGDQIEIFDIVKTASSFHAKERCDSRFYEYLLPTFVFKSISRDDFAQLIMLSSTRTDIMKDKVGTSDQSSNPDLEDKNEQTGVKDQSNPGDDQNSLVGQGDPKNQQDPSKGSNESRENQDNCANFSSEDGPDDPTDYHTRFKDVIISEEDRDEMAKYRSTLQEIDRFNKILSFYCGTRNFHNFTIGKSSTDPSAHRHIKSFTASAPFLVKDESNPNLAMEWVAVRAHGLSFMLHQIRKMIGLAILVMKFNLSVTELENLFARLFARDKKFNVPKAPALGLYLDKPLFEGYNKKFSSDPARQLLDFSSVEGRRESFKRRVIEPEIFRGESERNEFFKWLKCIEDHAYDFKYIIE